MRKIALRTYENHFDNSKVGSGDCKTHLWTCEIDSGRCEIDFGGCRVGIGTCKIDSDTFGDGVGEC
jgi:hypothetical protein